MGEARSAGDDARDMVQALRTALRHTDAVKEPRRVVAGALLLEEVQRHERARGWLEQRVREYLAGGAGSWRPERTLADRAEEVLNASGGPMNYRDVAAEIERRGFRHANRPRRSNQLAESVWTALNSDRRFVKVARGVWDVVRAENGDRLGELDLGHAARRITRPSAKTAPEAARPLDRAAR